MKDYKTLVLMVCLSMLFLTGFTIQNYNEWVKPVWFNYDVMIPYWNDNNQILDKVIFAKKELEKKGLEMTGVNVKISPHQYRGMNGVTLGNTTVIANNSYDTVYHELGHLYHNKNVGLIKKYESMLNYYYPDIVKRDDGSWGYRPEEDFAEEFKSLFVNTPKKTHYPSFPNFEEWVLRNTQQVEVKRKEAFDKLGGTKNLINNQVVIGNTKGDYMLDKNITRAELTTVLVRLHNLNQPSKTPFKDIKKQWYVPYVERIYGRGLIKGYPDNTFRGDNNITRYELHTIINRL